MISYYSRFSRLREKTILLNGLKRQQGNKIHKVKSSIFPTLSFLFSLYPPYIHFIFPVSTLSSLSQLYLNPLTTLPSLSQLYLPSHHFTLPFSTLSSLSPLYPPFLNFIFPLTTLPSLSKLSLPSHHFTLPFST